MSDLDQRLRESLNRLAEPGDPAGVAEAIRAEVGEGGAPGGGAPGDGGTGFLGGWVPVVIVGAVVGAGAGIALGLSGGPSDAGGGYAPMTLPADGSVPGAVCPGGATVAMLDAGARVLALGRTEDGTYLAVRDPGALGTLVWISAGEAIVDEGTDPDGLPIRACDEGSPISADAPEPAPVDTDEPAPGPQPEPGPAPAPNPPPPPPPPPADTQAPGIQVGGWSESYLNGPASCLTPPKTATITVVASDNVGVTAVTWSSTNAQVTLSGPVKSGNNYTFTATYSGASDSSTVVTFTARDAANNATPGNSASLPLYACFG